MAHRNSEKTFTRQTQYRGAPIPFGPSVALVMTQSNSGLADRDQMRIAKIPAIWAQHQDGVHRERNGPFN
jgi:hypothetical protein